MEVRRLSLVLVLRCLLVLFSSSDAATFSIPPEAPLIDGYYYVRHIDKEMGWSDAKRFCEITGGSMASPKTAAQFKHMYTALKRTYLERNIGYWLGVRRAASGVWRHSRDRSALMFDAWASHSPSPDDGWDCALLWNTEMRNSLPCDNTRDRYPLCAYDAGRFPNTTDTCSTSDIVVENSRHGAATSSNCSGGREGFTVADGSRVHVFCLDGYILRGPAVVTCDAHAPGGAGWTELPICSATCPGLEVAPPAEVLNPRPVYHDGEVVDLVCNGGYLLRRRWGSDDHPRTHTVLTCNATAGGWDPPVSDFGATITCLPESDFGHFQTVRPPHVDVERDIAEGAFMQLECDAVYYYISPTGWFRDQMPVSELPPSVLDFLHVSDADHVLTLTNFTADMAGVYHCGPVDRNTKPVARFRPMEFRVRLSCPAAHVAANVVEANVGESALLACAAYDPPPESEIEHALLPPIWYRDGARVWSSYGGGGGTVSQLADGSLFIERVGVSAEGEYICKTADGRRGRRHCKVRSTTRLAVKPTQP